MTERHSPVVTIMASGEGTTAETFIHATQSGVVDAEVGLVICNKSSADIFNKIKRLNRQYGLDIRALHISGYTHQGGPGEPGEQTLTESEAIAKEVTGIGTKLVLLLGYGRKVRGDLHTEYGWLPHHRFSDDSRMLNTHPGPLPETAGLYKAQTQERVLELGMDHTAQTLHFVASDYDTGPTLVEHRVPVMPGDEAHYLFDRLQATEKAHLPADIQRLLHGDLAHIDLR